MSWVYASPYDRNDSGQFSTEKQCYDHIEGRGYPSYRQGYDGGARCIDNTPTPCTPPEGGPTQKCSSHGSQATWNPITCTWDMVICDAGCDYGTGWCKDPPPPTWDSLCYAGEPGCEPLPCDPQYQDCVPEGGLQTPEEAQKTMEDLARRGGCPKGQAEYDMGLVLGKVCVPDISGALKNLPVVIVGILIIVVLGAFKR